MFPNIFFLALASSNCSRRWRPCCWPCRRRGTLEAGGASISSSAAGLAYSRHIRLLADSTCAPNTFTFTTTGMAPQTLPLASLQNTVVAAEATIGASLDVVICAGSVLNATTLSVPTDPLLTIAGRV